MSFKRVVLNTKFRLGLTSRNIDLTLAYNVYTKSLPINSNHAKTFIVNLICYNTGPLSR